MTAERRYLVCLYAGHAWARREHALTWRDSIPFPKLITTGPSARRV